jgi:hypothetical protein
MKTTRKVHPLHPASAPKPGRDALAPLEPSPEPSAGLPGRRSRTGKIARLPLAVREQLNRRLQNGEQGKRLVQWLNEQQEVRAVMAAEFLGRPVLESNLSEWRNGGYRDWQRQQEARQAVLSFVEEAGGLQSAAKEGLTELLAFYLAAQTALELKRLESVAFSPEQDRARRELAGRVVALRRGDLALERLRLERDKHGLRHKTKEEKEAEFWKWAEDNINRDEFCRRRCFTYEQREAAIDKILGITPAERHEVEPGNEDVPASQNDDIPTSQPGDAPPNQDPGSPSSQDGSVPSSGAPSVRAGFNVSMKPRTRESASDTPPTADESDLT